MAKAQHLDRTYIHTAPDTVGPVETRLRGYGPVQGVVFGHWAETSPDVEHILVAAATVGARRHWRGMRSPDAKTAVGALVWMLRRRWGIVAWRANVRLLLDRQEYAGAGAPEAATRREAARAGATRARQDAFVARCTRWGSRPTMRW